MVPLNTSLERLVRAVSALGAFAFISISLITPQADAAVYPPEISYIGIVRDFSMMASDFEVPTESSVAQRNLLAANLEGFPDLAVPVFVPYRLRGTTGYPLLSTGGPPSALAIANYGQMYFDEWYRDVPGVNIPMNINLTFALTDPTMGVYTYDSFSPLQMGFFPINRKGFGSMEYCTADAIYSNNSQPQWSNFALTTEYRVRFFYRGGETFQFSGDDDLWVFIDGKLTTCDLGGIHSAISCNINLAGLGLNVSTTYEMLVIHAERHGTGSNFRIATSILPLNDPPTCRNRTVTLLECSEEISFDLASSVTDLDSSDRAFVSIIECVSGCVAGKDIIGQLTVPIQNSWYEAVTPIKYKPFPFTFGTVVYSFRAFDGKDNSTNLGYLTIVVNAVPNPPIAFDIFASTVYQETLAFKLSATDIDTAQGDLCYRILKSPQGTVVSFNTFTGIIVYKSTALIVRDTIIYVANDRGNCDASANSTSSLRFRLGKRMEVREGDSQSAKVSIEISLPAPIVPATPPENTKTMDIPKVAGIIVGSILAAAVVAGIAAVAVYWRLSANKFQSVWEEQFRAAHAQSNPLYQGARTEFANPLYERGIDAPVASMSLSRGAMTYDGDNCNSRAKLNSK